MIAALALVFQLASQPWIARVWSIAKAPTLFAPGPSSRQIEILEGDAWMECQVASGKLTPASNPPSIGLPPSGLVAVGKSYFPAVYRSPRLNVARLPGNVMAFVPSSGPIRVQPIPENLLKECELNGTMSLSIIGHPDTGPYGIMAGHSPMGWLNAPVFVDFFNVDGTPSRGQAMDQAGHLHPRRHAEDALAKVEAPYFADDLEESFWVGGGWVFDGWMSPRHWESDDASYSAVVGWPGDEKLAFADGDYLYTVKSNRLTCWRFHPPHEGNR